jgi:uncharacterized membrane protein
MLSAPVGRRVVPDSAAVLSEVRMATLTVWKFDDPDKAGEAVAVLADLEKQGMIHVVDATWVSWPPGRRGPKTHPLNEVTKIGAVGGGFFGFLAGVLFFAPILGLAVGAVGGAAAGRLADVGITDAFIGEVREKVTPGSSALFALTQDAVEDRVAKAFSGFHAELITSNLSDEQETHLRETFFAD